jgi:site-specific DNA-methyltransferase (adenine-specific)
LKLSEIHINPSNPRIIKDDRFKKLVKSISEFPKMMELRPIIIDSEGTILGGNMRFKALQELKYKDIPNEWIKRADKLTDEEKQRFIIEDNVGFGEWDFDILANEWDRDKLIEWGLELPSDFGVKLNAVEDDYEIPETIKTDIVLGDLFEIGNHRLLCGDSKDSDAVAKLMGGVLADLVVTDPPYNTGMKANKDAKAWLSQMFDDSFTPEGWADLKTSSFNNYNLFTKGECAFYVFIDWRRVAEFKEVLETIADVKNVIVWDKGVHGLGSDYKSTYENIVVGKKGKPKINNRVGLDYQDIWRVQRKMGRDDDHATKKPIELLQKPIIHASKEDDIVLDLFGGSGSTMITAHQLKRRCYMQELSPKYCQCVIDRMLKLDPSIVIKKNGKLI